MSTDPFSGIAFGGYINAATIDPIKKVRSYSANAYYEPVMGRRNLQVITEAVVEKILFASTSGKDTPVANGVQYKMNGSTRTIKAQMEVVLSVRTFSSSKILELSGMGSKDLLHEYGISVVMDNPNVGENLQDHVLSGLSFEVQDSIKTKDDLMRREPAAISVAMEDYKTRRFGPFTVGGNYSSALLSVPDFQTQEVQEIFKKVLDSLPSPLPGSFNSDLTLLVRSLLQDPHEASGGYFTYPAQTDFKGSGAGSEVIRTKLPENYITIAVMLLHPLSRGSTHITSTDVEIAPSIDPHYLPIRSTWTC